MFRYVDASCLLPLCVYPKTHTHTNTHTHTHTNTHTNTHTQNKPFPCHYQQQTVRLEVVPSLQNTNWNPEIIKYIQIHKQADREVAILYINYYMYISQKRPRMKFSHLIIHTNINSKI